MLFDSLYNLYNLLVPEMPIFCVQGSLNMGLPISQAMLMARVNSIVTDRKSSRPISSVTLFAFYLFDRRKCQKRQYYLAYLLAKKAVG
jgi:hypothetical protein